MRGRYPRYYIECPWAFPLEQAFEELDAFTYEEFTPAELGFTIVLLPPLWIAGTRTKGLLFSAGVDALSAVTPSYREGFLTIANSRWASYPWSLDCDGAFVCYNNPVRAEYYRNTHFSRAHRLLIPRQTADYTDEQLFRPDGDVEKKIDVLIVCRLAHAKNLIGMAGFLVELRKRREGKPLRIAWATDVSLSAATKMASCRNILSQLQASFGEISSYIDWMGPVAPTDMPSLYRRSRTLLLPSLVEGKNRAIAEAMCSDVPVVVLEEFNSAARGPDRAIPAGAGLCVKNSPAAVADGIVEILTSSENFHPRRAYLKDGGRERFFWACVEAFPYFREIFRLSDGLEQSRTLIDSAMREQYGLSLTHFLYYSHGGIATANDAAVGSLHRADGQVQVQRLLDFYLRRWRANA